MIFQDPMTSLNPVYRIGKQIAEPLRLHKGMSKSDAWAAAVELLAQVGIPQAEERARNYPHEFSGGMRQRAMIAMALACGPDILIADEPTTALDVTIQAQILELMQEIQKRTESAIIMITHDLGVVADMADHILVMYAGKAVEYGPPTTCSTSRCTRTRGACWRACRGTTWTTKAPSAPSTGSLPVSSLFRRDVPSVRGAPTPLAMCRTEAAALVEIEPGHLSSCHFCGRSGVHRRFENRLCYVVTARKVSTSERAAPQGREPQQALRVGQGVIFSRFGETVKAVDDVSFAVARRRDPRSGG